MVSDKERLQKIASVSEVSFTGRDQHGDFIVVRFKEEAAEHILAVLKSHLMSDSKMLRLVK